MKLLKRKKNLTFLKSRRWPRLTLLGLLSCLPLILTSCLLTSNNELKASSVEIKTAPKCLISDSPKMRRPNSWSVRDNGSLMCVSFPDWKNHFDDLIDVFKYTYELQDCVISAEN